MNINGPNISPAIAAAAGYALAGSKPTAATNQTWTANLIMYYPFFLEETFVSQLAWMYNGSAANAGNWAIGVYAPDGTCLGKSTARAQQGGTSVIDSYAFAVTIPPGSWYLGFGADSASLSVFALNSGLSRNPAVGIFEQASGYSSGLPSPAVYAINTTAGLVPWVGLHRGSVM